MAAQTPTNQHKNSNAIRKYEFIYHFLPHPELKSRAKLLSNQAFIVYCVIMLLFFGIFTLLPKVLPGILGYASDITVPQLLDLTNKERQKAGFSELRLNPALSRAADKKGKDMFKKNYWAHISPDGTKPWDFILEEDYDYLYAGENLAKNFLTSQEVVAAWYDSPSHRDNLLNSNYNEVGFAVVNGVLNGYETTLVVQLFGSPRDLSTIITKEEEAQLLQKYAAVPQTQTASTYGVQSSRTIPSINPTVATRYISVLIVSFVILLLGIDVWYSSKKGILKFTGHTYAHMLMLVIVLIGIWFAVTPGKIL